MGPGRGAGRLALQPLGGSIASRRQRCPPRRTHGGIGEGLGGAGALVVGGAAAAGGEELDGGEALRGWAHDRRRGSVAIAPEPAGPCTAWPSQPAQLAVPETRLQSPQHSPPPARPPTPARRTGRTARGSPPCRSPQPQRGRCPAARRGCAGAARASGMLLLPILLLLCVGPPPLSARLAAALLLLLCCPAASHLQLLRCGLEGGRKRFAVAAPRRKEFLGAGKGQERGAARRQVAAAAAARRAAAAQTRRIQVSGSLRDCPSGANADGARIRAGGQQQGRARL